ncbi:hypothetical protein ACIRSU_02400 [Streptomyces sp. NPDC101160]
MATYGPFQCAVQETLLIPLYGRAVEHRKEDASRHVRHRQHVD